MKHLFTFLIIIFSLSVSAQTINHISFLPANPTDQDTVQMVIDFSYTGDCNFGMVYCNVFLTNDTILVMPTYCGYNLTTQCNSIDTVSLGSFNPGQYVLQLDIHQGSVCPISGFDAIIAHKDTSLNVSAFSGITSLTADAGVDVFPNPVNDLLSIRIKRNFESVELQLYQMNGILIHKTNLNPDLNQIKISQLKLSSGVYLCLIKTDNQTYYTKIILSN